MEYKPIADDYLIFNELKVYVSSIYNRIIVEVDGMTYFKDGDTWKIEGTPIEDRNVPDSAKDVWAIIHKWIIRE